MIMILFAARHGRGALDPTPKVGEQITTRLFRYNTPPMAGPELINPMERVMPIHDDVHQVRENKELSEGP